MCSRIACCYSAKSPGTLLLCGTPGCFERLAHREIDFGRRCADRVLAAAIENHRAEDSAIERSRAALRTAFPNAAAAQKAQALTRSAATKISPLASPFST